MTEIRDRVLNALRRNKDQLLVHRKAHDLPTVEAFACGVYERAFLDCAVICNVLTREEAAELKTMPNGNVRRIDYSPP